MPLKSRLQQLRTRLVGQGTARATVSTSIGEITPCNARAIDDARPRLNLLLPSINARHYFGGIHTAVSLYRDLLLRFGQSRIVLVDSAPDAEALARFPDHAGVDSEADAGGARQIVAFNDRYGRTIPVGAGDVWLATAWWTAYAAQRLAGWQQRTFGMPGRVAYLIQDFEPGFYAWSSHSALALSTYRPEMDLAIFNTRLLESYFRGQGLDYRQSWTFEPTLNRQLRAPLQALRSDAVPRERRILLYARPSTPRNAFELLCEALRQWGWSDVRSHNWEVVAVGELAEDIDLGPLRLRALGKLDIGAYADLLSRSSVGLSLMVSPHPSYPPLEMAAFGLRVLTNSYANKDLSTFSPNITSVPFAPESIAQALSAACDEAEARAMAGLPPMSARHPFVGEDGFASIAGELASALLL